MYQLKLYLVGTTRSSAKAIEELKALLEEKFKGQYYLEVIDVLKNPQLAESDNILATPTVIKSEPEPVRRIIGDLSDSDKVLLGLNMVPNLDNVRN
jgi:circadian clock protein KaiB